MDTHTIEAFAPYIVIIVMFLIQNHIFVTPAQLLEKVQEIYEHIEHKYVTKTQVSSINASINDIKDKTDKIYDIIIARYASTSTHNNHEE